MQSITSFLAFCAFHTQVSALALQGAGASGRAVAAGREEAALRSEMMSAMSKRQPLSRTKIFETSLNSSNDTSNETCLNETIPWLQIGFAMDCTGSTQPYLDALKTTVYDLAVEFNASVSLLQMAFLCYRDEGDVTPPRYEWAVHPDPLSHWFEDPVQLQNEIAPFYSMGGGDSPEDNAGAMGQMLHNNPWDPSAVKILMVISKDRDSMRTPYDTDASQCQLMQDIRAKNISLILGHLDTDTTTSMLYDSTYKPTLPWRGCYADPSDAEQMKEIQFMGLSPENFSALLIDEVRDSSFNALCPSVPTAQPTPAPPTAVPALASPTSAPTLAPWLANSWEYLDHPFGESCYPDSAVKSMAECEHAAASLGLGYIVSSPVDSNGLSYGCHFTPGASPLLVFNDCFDCGTASTNSHAICRHVPTPQPTQAPWETNSYGYEEPRPVGTQCLVGSEILSMAECQYAAHSKGMYFNVSSLIDSSLLPYGCHYIPGASPHLVFNEFSECGLASITTNAQAICEQEVTAHPTQAPWTTHALQYTELSVVGLEVTSVEECDDAVSSLGIVSVAPSSIDSNGMPYGCYHKPGATSMIFFNTCSDCGPSSTDSHAICRQSTPAPTPLPTLAPTPQPTPAPTMPTAVIESAITTGDTMIQLPAGTTASYWSGGNALIQGNATSEVVTISGVSLQSLLVSPTVRSYPVGSTITLLAYTQLPTGAGCDSTEVSSFAECEQAATLLGIVYLTASPVDSNGMPHGCYYVPAATPLIVFNNCTDCGSSTTHSHAICRHVVPTAQPTASPTISAPLVGGASTPSVGGISTPPVEGGESTGGVAQAIGDPHLQNIHGERFDLMEAGKHVLIHIPRRASISSTLLRVQGDVQQLGGLCDMYFQELNITGTWADEKRRGGFSFRADGHGGKRRSRWLQFGAVGVKVAHGRTGKGICYLNFYVKHLTKTSHLVGGLLGEDDHTRAAARPSSCGHRVAL